MILLRFKPFDACWQNTVAHTHIPSATDFKNNFEQKAQKHRCKIVNIKLDIKWQAKRER